MTELEIINKYLGIPYRNHGRNIDGLDCYGLIIFIYKDFGIELFDIDADYDDDWSWDGHNLLMENVHFDWEEIKEQEQFCIVAFENGKGIVNHAGIMLDTDRFLHCCKAGVVVSRLSNFKEKRFAGFYRHKGMK
jgi:cell wall-associated NlpC family hydrolase